ENNSFLKMAIPAEGMDAVRAFVIDCVIGAGGKTCPPTVLGVGLGGTSDLCVALAKRAATRALGTQCSDPHGAQLELELSKAVNHTAPNVKKVEPSPQHPAGYAPVCIGTTTSERMERFTRPLMTREGVRLIIGKGGMRDASLAAFKELAGAYLAIVGGTAALE